MRRGFTSITRIVTLLFILATAAIMGAQANTDTSVGVSANQQGNAVYFTVYNQTGGTVCVWPYVQEQTNVNGSVVPMTELGAGASGVSIGAYAQADPSQAWSVRVGSKWRAGDCASQ